jgi:sterol 3beta-glucosyltransferase
MHYGLFTYGSRGDVQPYIALALGLTEAGHTVTLAAPQNFKGLVEGYGIRFHALHGDAEEIVYSPECLEVIRSGNDIAFIRYMFGLLYTNREPLLQSMTACAGQVDLMVVNNLGAAIFGAVAQKLDKPLVIVQLNPPTIRTAEFAAPGIDFINVSWFNKMTYHVVNILLWKLSKKAINEYRRLLELTPLTQVSYQQFINHMPVIHAYSPQLFKQPADWRAHHRVTGFLSMPRQTNAQPLNTNPTLTAWLNSGTKPVYIGFGSIPVPDEARLEAIVAELLTNASYRILLCTGWSKLQNLPKHPNLFIVNQINHEWILSQCTAAVIHGGIGTLAAVLKAGIPAIVVSIFVDQPIWGKVIQRKKVGVHLPWKRLTFSRLLKALNMVSHDGYQSNVEEISYRLHKEDGVGQAVEVIQHRHQTTYKEMKS